MIPRPFLSTCYALLFCGAFPAQAVILYDASVGTLPGAQNWQPFIFPFTVQSHDGSATRLNTTALRAAQSGYFSEDPDSGSGEHPDLGVLDRFTGYTLRLNLQVLEENHDLRDDNGDGKYDRAGFSLIVISEDMLGLEIGFFKDRVWAYADASEPPAQATPSLFTQAEGQDFNTTAAMTSYDLVVSGTGYSLFADQSLLFGGMLRDYNPSGVPAEVNPYDNPSFVFFGDDTGSADSDVLIGNVELNPPAAVPEPSTLLPLTALLLIARRCVRRT